MFRVMEDAPTFMAAGAGAANLAEFRDEANVLVASVDPDGHITTADLSVQLDASVMGTLTVGSLVVDGDTVSASTIAQSARDDYIRLSMEVL
jgi:hypothetical protein